MQKLIDYTKILRSKNAGPLFITFDLIFPDRETMQYVLKKLTKEQIAAAISACGFDERVRGEVLSIEDFARLSDALCAQ